MTYSRPLAPVESARPTPDAAIRDRIFLRDHVVEVEIGAFQVERGVRQRLRFHIAADLLARPAGVARDDVDGIVSYDILADAVADELAEGRINLLETLAERIAARVLAAPGLAGVSVEIEKLDRVSGAFGVTIHRKPVARDPRIAAALPDGARVCVLGAEAASEGIAAILDRADAPTVLCVETDRVAESDLPVPVRRRVDLLAFEQAAWRLAARDRRCVVVDSRTELDWGLRHGQVSVWAPSKMVADAREDVPPMPLAMPDLAVWLAARLGLGRVDLVGAAAPTTEAEGIEIRRRDDL